MHNETLRRVRVTVVAINIKYSECVSVALIIQHAKRMHRIILLAEAFLTLHIFPHYLINGTSFGKKLLKIKCFVFLYNYCLKHFSL